MAKALPVATLILLGLAVAADARADESSACLDASEAARDALGKRRLLDARAHLRRCAAQSCEESVRTLCDERLVEVAARVPTIIFDATDPGGRDLPDVKLTIDGVVHSEGPLGSEIAVDPGSHAFLFEIANEAAVELRLVLVERDKGRREHVRIGRAREELASNAALQAANQPGEERMSPWRTAGWLTLGAGGVAIGIGSAFGVLAMTKNKDAGCDASNICDDPRARHDARTAANVATAGIVVGAALAAAGVGLVLLAPRKRQPAAVVQLGPAGLMLEGRF